MRNVRWTVAFGLPVLIACGADVGPTNPFDPLAPAGLQARATLAGTVLREESDATAPLEGARIVLADDGEIVGTPVQSGTDGRFVLQDLLPGRYTLEVVHAQHLRHVREITLEPGIARDLPIVLDPLPAVAGADTGHLTGQVLKSGELERPEGEADHSGILVEVEDAGVRTVTNAAGEFDLFLRPGTYHLVFSARNYNLTRRNSVEVAADTTTVVPDGPVVLDPNPGSIAGRIRLEGAGDGEHGDAVVSVPGGRTTTTAPDGTYRLAGLAAGTYTLTVSRSGFDTLHVSGLTVEGGGETAAPDIALAKSRGGIAGRVRLAGRIDHSGIAVELTGTVFTAVTNIEGDFAISGIPVGVYELTARHTGYVRGVIGSVTVAADTVTEVETLNLPRQQGDFDINGGASYTRERDVTLGLTVQNAVEMRIAESPELAGVAWVSFESQPIFTLSEGDGLKTIYVQYRDADEVESPVFSSSIVLDTAPPIGTSVEINGGATHTNNADGIVTLRFTAMDETSGVRDLRVSNDGVFDTEPWQPFVDALTWTLAEPTVDGLKTVWVQFRDHAGNETPLPATAGIVLDREPPVLTGFTIDCDGRVDAEACGTHLVSLSIGATGATFMALANDPGFGTEVYEPFAEQRSWLLSPGDGEKRVWIRLMDEAGNKNTATFDDILLDTVPPDMPVVVLAGGETYVASGTGVSLSVMASGATEMRIAVDGVLDDEPWVPYAVGNTVDLPSGDGLRTVHVQVRDLALNRSPIASASVTVDGTPPVIRSVRVADGSEWVTSSDGSTTVRVDCADAVAPTSSLSLRIEMDGGQTLYDGALVDVVPVVLGSTEGPRQITARCADPAGNEGASDPVSVVVDHTPPAVGSFILNGGGAGERTGDPAITVSWSVSDPVSGSPRVAIAESSLDCETASYDLAPSGSRVFTLSPGDGLRSFYLCARDRAGNFTTPATVSSNAVYLDTEPPATPDLFRTSLTDTEVGLAWTIPSDPFLEGFVLQRRVAGEGRFTTIAMPGPTEAAWLDPVAPESLGLERWYRIAAYDDVGNQSSWSIELSVGIPFEPITRTSYLWSAANYRRSLTWRIPPGTALSSAQYSYEDAVTGQIVEGGSAVNVEALTLDPPDGRTNERLTFRNSNADGSLVWESAFHFGSERRRIVEGGFPDHPVLAVDARGVGHVAYSDVFSGDLGYQRLDGVSAPIVLQAATYANDYLAIAIHPSGIPYVAHRDNAGRAVLIRVDDACRADPEAACTRWVVSDASTTDMALAFGGDGVGHLIHRTSGTHHIRIDAACLANAPAACQSRMIDSAAASGRIPVVAIDQTGTPVAAYRVATATPQIKFVRLVDESSTPVVIQEGAGVGLSLSLAFGEAPTHLPYVTHIRSGPARVEYIAVSSSCQSNSPPDNCNAVPITGDSVVAQHASMATDANGTLHVAFRGTDARLHLLEADRVCRTESPPSRCEPQTIHGNANVGHWLSLAAGPDQRLYVVHRELQVYHHLWYQRVERPPSPHSVHRPNVTDHVGVAVDSAGVAHAAYTVTSPNEVRYRRLDGMTPSEVLDEVRVLDIRMAMDPGDVPVVAYVVATTGELKYVRVDGASGPQTLLASGASRLSMTMDAEGTPRLAYRNGSNLEHRVVDGASTPEVLDTGAVVATAVAVDDAGVSHVVYAVNLGNQVLEIRHATPIRAPRVLQTASGSGLSLGAGFDVAGRLHVAWTDEGEGVVHYAAGEPSCLGTSACAPMAVMDASLGGGIAMAVDAHGVAHVSLTNDASNLVQYVRVDAVATVQTIETTNQTVNRIALALDPGGTPHLVYRYRPVGLDELRHVRGPFAAPLSPTWISSP
jgi:hypothetical protein